MRGQFTLEYWPDGKWYFGRLVEVPGVFTQARSIKQLQENIQDAYDLVVTRSRSTAPVTARRQPLEIEVEESGDPLAW